MALGHKTVNFYWFLSAAITSFVLPSKVHAALPPATLDVDERAVAEQRAVAAAAEPATANRIVDFAMDPLRVGGTLSYSLGYDSAGGASSKQQGIGATLNARTGLKGYIWHPALSDFAGSVGISTHSESNSSNGAAGTNSSESKGITIVGNAKLSVLPYSRIPFELHLDRSDTRTSSNLAPGDGYISQHYGFSQRYTGPKISGTLLWDRDTQFNEKNGGSRQDNLQVSATPVLGPTQQLQLSGSSAHNSRETTGEHTTQDNVAAQHTYTPSPDISVDNSVNLSHSGYRLAQGESDAHFSQLSSLVFWRPKDTSLTMTGGVRLFALTNGGGNTDSPGNAFAYRSRNTNFNVGANYDFSQFTRLTASGNLNLVDNNGAKSASSNEALALTYSPDQILLGKYKYAWSTSANAGNNAGGQKGSEQQLSLQLSHGLSRTIDLSGNALGMSVSESISSQFSNTAEPSKQLSHSGTLSLSLSQGALLSLTVSDSRTLGSNDFFQMANFQASSNLATGIYSSWTGSLTIQATRQRQKDSTSVAGSNSQNAGSPDMTTTSSGAISYQNQRAFGIPRLQFVSDLRLNSQALLPVLSGPEEHVTRSWDNSLGYVIGRTQLNLSARLSKSVGTTNKSIMFTATRAYGNS